VQVFDLKSLKAEAETRQQAWTEFLRSRFLSMGIYRLKAGQNDQQQPHTEDEVYFVVEGSASFRAGNEQRTVGPGEVIFVERTVEHRFFDITEDVTLLVFFAPPEGSGRTNP
jgi:mannose-6-phosphate isomerase-like protein (cupin superfamily)